MKLAMLDAARQAMQRLADDENLAVDALNEPWAQPLEIKTPSGISLRMALTDINRRFDVNNLYMDLPGTLSRSGSDILMDIMTLCGDFAPVEKTEALKDWIDPDQEGLRESSFYLEKNPPYSTPDQWLASRSELHLVDGFDAAYFDRADPYRANRTFAGNISECITVIPGMRNSPAPVNVNTASRETLLGVVGLENEHWVRMLLALRTETPLASLARLQHYDEGPGLSAPAPWLDVRSYFFELRIRAYADGPSADLYAVLKRTRQGHVEVIRWVWL
jgi:type II secretory pathway component PulK